MAACSSSPSSSSSGSYNFNTPDPVTYGNKNPKDFRIMWYRYEDGKVGYVEKITPSGNPKSDSALWSVDISVVKNYIKKQYTLPVFAGNITIQNLRVGDIVEYTTFADHTELRKVQAYVQYLPKMDIKDYNPQKMDEVYNGKGLNDLVPKYQDYDWTKKYGYARIVKITVPDIGLWTISLEGPGGYKQDIELTQDRAFDQQYHIGTVVELEFIGRQFINGNYTQLGPNHRAEYKPLITPAEYNAFLHGGDPNNPLVVVNGKTAEQAMWSATFDIFDYVPDNVGDE